MPESGPPIDKGALDWAEAEFATADLGDRRLKKRLVVIAQAFAAKPNAQVPQATDGWPEAKAAYRFFDNEKVDPEKILAPHRESTKERLAGKSLVLAIQDTSDLNFNAHPSAEDLGPIGDTIARGILIHPTIAVSLEGAPVGLIDLQIWTREKDSQDKGQRKKSSLPIEKKESVKWLNGYRATASLEKEQGDVHFVVVCDREGDVFELLAEAERLSADEKPSKPDLLVRASWDRRVWHPQGNLWAQLGSEKPAGQLIIQVPRKPGTPEREANLTIRFARVTIQPPNRIPRRKQFNGKVGPIIVWAVFALEESPPKGIEPISWMLLSTMPVESFDDAIEKLKWYVLRWTIELFFKALKSGCSVEQRQLKTFDRLKNCIALDCVVAWRIMFCTTMGREVPDLPASVLFEEYEWKALHSYVNKTEQVPEKAPTLGWVVREVAKLGGFLARKGDGDPGMKTLWRGLLVLRSISTMWLVFNRRSRLKR